MSRSTREKFAVRRIGAALLVTCLIPVFTAGCFGKFQLTRKLYQANRDFTTDKWVRWLGFLALTILPIYGIAVFVDAFVANSLEFWTGKNPILAQAGSTRVSYGPNGEVGESTLLADGSIWLSLREANGRLHELQLVREENGVAALDASGAVLGRVVDVGGEPRLIAAAR